MTDSETSFYQQELSQQFGLQGLLSRLPGEYDLNFLVSDNNDPVAVLKVMRPGCDEVLVDMQCAAMEHLCQTGSALPLPRVVRSQDQSAFAVIQDQKGQSRLAWCIGHLKGGGLRRC